MIKINITAISLVVCFLASCSAKNSITSTAEEVEVAKGNPYVDTETEFTSINLESQTTFPGVHSNLKSITRYTLSLSVDLNSEIQFANILVDDVAIPFSALHVNDEKQADLILRESTSGVKLNASRMNYSNDDSAPQIHKEVEYQKTGQNLKDKAVIEYFIDGKPFYLEINEIKRLPKIYAP